MASFGALSSQNSLRDTHRRRPAEASLEEDSSEEASQQARTSGATGRQEGPRAAWLIGWVQTYRPQRAAPHPCSQSWRPWSLQRPRRRLGRACRRASYAGTRTAAFAWASTRCACTSSWMVGGIPAPTSLMRAVQQRSTLSLRFGGLVQKHQLPAAAYPPYPAPPRPAGAGAYGEGIEESDGGVEVQRGALPSSLEEDPTFDVSGWRRAYRRHRATFIVLVLLDIAYLCVLLGFRLAWGTEHSGPGARAAWGGWLARGRTIPTYTAGQGQAAQPIPANSEPLQFLCPHPHPQLHPC